MVQFPLSTPSSPSSYSPVMAPSMEPEEPPQPYDTFADLDAPPAYDAVTGPSSTGSSSAAAAAAAAAGPTAAHLFSTPYSAEPRITEVEARQRVLHTIRVDSNLASADPRLQDPNLLYHYVRSLAVKPFDVHIALSGTHKVVAQISETVHDNGVPRHVRAGESYTVTDFDFTIPIQSVFGSGENVEVWTVPPGQPARRGGHSLVTGSPGGGGRHELSCTEGPAWAKWDGERLRKGLPGWVKLHYSPASGSISEDLETQALINEEDVGVDRRALREWCEAFVRDPGYLREFRVAREAWGWEWDRLVQALDAAIKSTGYTGDWKCKVDNRDFAVVRPDNWLSRAVNTPWIFTILCVTLVYPFIWIWQRLHRLGGGTYDVARVSFGLKSYLPLPGTYAAETVAQARARLPELRKAFPLLPANPTLAPGPQGVHYLAGVREGAWFRACEERVRMGVRMGFRGVLDDVRVEVPRVDLDGY